MLVHFLLQLFFSCLFTDMSDPQRSTHDWNSRKKALVIDSICITDTTCTTLLQLVLRSIDQCLRSTQRQHTPFKIRTARTAKNSLAISMNAHRLLVIQMHFLLPFHRCQRRFSIFRDDYYLTSMWLKTKCADVSLKNYRLTVINADTVVYMTWAHSWGSIVIGEIKKMKTGVYIKNGHYNSASAITADMLMLHWRHVHTTCWPRPK